MSNFIRHLAHFTHGMAFMFFIIMAIRIFPFGKKNRIMHILFWVMIFWAFIVLKDLGYLLDGVWSNPYVSSIHLSFDLWCVPAIIVLLFEVISPQWTTLRKVVLVFLPSVLLTILFVLTAHEVFYTILVVYSNVVGLLALGIVLIASSRYDKFIKINFSYSDNMTLEWIRFLIVALYFALVAWTLINSWSTWLGDVFFYIFQIAIWSGFYYYARKHHVISTPNLTELLSFKNDREKPTDEDCNSTEENEKFVVDLQRIMEEEKIYLNPQLNISTLASAIGTNRTYLSSYLNHQLNTNFYDYINQFRVKEACELLTSQHNRTLEDISDLCGFNSISTFRRSFIKNMNETPVEYKNKYRNPV